jgi:hypothetical protein
MDGEGARRRLLEEFDMEERPAATLPQSRQQYLEKVAGVKVSESSVRAGCSSGGWDGAEKKIGGCE